MQTNEWPRRFSLLLVLAGALSSTACRHRAVDGSQGDQEGSGMSQGSADAASPARTAPEGQTARAIIEGAWSAVTREQRGMFYGLAISPAYPTEWPLAAGTDNPSFRTYGFAYGMDPEHMVADGQHTSSAWIIVTTPAKGALLIERAPFFDLGIQGVSPVVAGSFPTDAERDQAVVELAAKPAKPSALVQKVYCTFGKYNGVFAQTLAQKYAPFLTWLACP